MTAIFAFADRDTVAVGGDSLRTYIGYGGVLVPKIHVWSPGVLLAQAGEGKFLSGLIYQLLQQAHFVKQLHSTHESDEQFIQAFKQQQPKFLSEAQRVYAKSPAGMNGTVLIAAARTAKNPARIHLMDFVTAKETLSTHHFEVEGTNPNLFRNNLMPSLANTPMQFDQICHDFVSKATSAYSNDIGFPARIIMSRITTGERVLHYREMQHATTTWLPEFQI